MNKKFGVSIDGISPGRMKKYGEVIKIVKKSKRAHKQKESYFISYNDVLISNQFPNKIMPPLVEDLINISLATFAADRAVQRDSYVPAKNRSEEGRFFSRKIYLTIPV